MKLGILLKNFLVSAMLFGFANPYCDETTCRLGAVCRRNETQGENRGECVCPTFPCTPEFGSEYVACGDDGVTYESVCVMRQTMCEKQKWIDIKHQGPCGDRNCHDSYDCLYGGRCIRGKCKCVACRDVADRRVYYRGKLADVDVSRAWKRTTVCGTDGVTYPSMCHLRYHSCMAKKYIDVEKSGLCKPERRTIARSAFVVQPVRIVETPASLRAPQTNCSTVEFVHCASRRHPRFAFMGSYAKMEEKVHHGSPVYELMQRSSRNKQEKKVYMSRHVTTKRPNGIWIVGSKVGSGKGWMAVADPSPLPENIGKNWQTASLRAVWRDENKLQVRCFLKEEIEYECLKTLKFKNDLKSNWDKNVVPPRPLYVLNLVRPKRKKYKSGGKIIVELRAKKQWKRIRAYILRLTTDRIGCGVPILIGKKNLQRNKIRCGGTVIISKNSKRKLLKIKFRFKAPNFGCVTISASVLSVSGYVYEDDILTKTLCSKKS